MAKDPLVCYHVLKHLTADFAYIQDVYVSFVLADVLTNCILWPAGESACELAC